MTRSVLITGASTGIGEAAVRRATEAGWQVLASARREDRLKKLAEQTGCAYVVADLTVDEDVERLVEAAVEMDVRALVNNAGGAIGVEKVEDGDPADWLEMYNKNVLSTLRLTKALLPHLRGRGGGDILTLTSTAAHGAYPGGAGYTAAKHAERMIPNTLRLELMGEPIRVIEIAPGMVHSPEFSLNRYRGDQGLADAVYAGVDHPLSPADVAEAIMWTLELPEHVNIDSMIIRPRAQASNTAVARNL